MKSLSETHPAFGSASGPVDVQRYCDGRSQVVVGVGDGVDDCVGDGVEGGVEGGAGVPGLPVQVTP
ncbi:MAG: hypothetical protein C0P63_018565, partial [Actinomycetales bacterium]